MIRTLLEGTTAAVRVKMSTETGQQNFLIQVCLFRLIVTEITQTNMKNNFNLEMPFPIQKIMLICRII